jgi:NitT/TauT family transport system ATP-binding protein
VKASTFHNVMAGHDEGARVPAMTGSVDIGNVTLTYRSGSGGVLALQGTTLNVRRGEFAAVVGPSGCGKSSLMKLVTGLVPPDSGSIVIFGDKVQGPVKIAGMAFQNPNLLPWRKVVDNVLLPLEIVQPHRQRFRQHKVQYREQANALLKTVGLDGFGERYPWELSGGMQQRVSLCRALIHEPALLMLDEPFAALDAFTREELWCVLRDLWQKLGFTVILVTHDLREAAFLADNIHVMSSRPGRIVMTKQVDLPRPRELDICYELPFTDIVHELRGKIAEVRKA